MLWRGNCTDFAFSSDQEAGERFSTERQHSLVYSLERSLCLLGSTREAGRQVASLLQ